MQIKCDRINGGISTYGRDLSKALSWFCQMDGYLLKVNSFDMDKRPAGRFTVECPKLMAFRGKSDVEGEALKRHLLWGKETIW